MSRAAVVATSAAALLGAIPAAAGAQDPRPTATPDRVVLTPTATPERSQRVAWRTDGAVAESRMELQALREGRPEGEVRQVAGTSEAPRATGPHGGDDYAVRHHRAVATGLQPGASYRYRVGGAPGWSAWRTFTTATADVDRPWRWLYVGDAQNGLDREWPVHVGRAFAAAPDAQLVLHAGDQVNRPTYDEDWGHWFAGLGEVAATTNQLAVPGNHEYNYDTKSFDLDGSGFRAHLPLEPGGASMAAGLSTSVDYRGVRFITLDTGLAGIDVFSLLNQRGWLEERLRSNRQRWTVVSFHFPTFTSADRFPSSNPIVRTAFGDLIEQHGVDLVLQGHDHVYSRGFRRADGPQYVTSVLGPKYYELQGDRDNDHVRNGARRVVAAQDTSTYQVICMEGDRLAYQSFVAAQGSDAPTPHAIGDRLDAFTIDKRGGRKQVRDGGTCATSPTSPAPGPGAGSAPAGLPASALRTARPTVRWRSGRVVRRTSALRVRLRFTGAGRVTVHAADPRRASRRLAVTVRRSVTAGTRTITLRPSAVARRELRRGRTVRARVTVRFRPRGGATRTVRRTLVVRPVRP